MANLEPQPRDCPRCWLANTPTTERCECGFDFVTPDPSDTTPEHFIYDHNNERLLTAREKEFLRSLFTAEQKEYARRIPRNAWKLNLVFVFLGVICCVIGGPLWVGGGLFLVCVVAWTERHMRAGRRISQHRGFTHGLGQRRRGTLMRRIVHASATGSLAQLLWPKICGDGLIVDFENVWLLATWLPLLQDSTGKDIQVDVVQWVDWPAILNGEHNVLLVVRLGDRTIDGDLVNKTLDCQAPPKVVGASEAAAW